LEEGAAQTAGRCLLMFAMKGNTMSDTNRVSKVHYREYLTNKDEPKHHVLLDATGAELEVDLIRNSYREKRKLRHTAARLRYAI